ncbi:hypothetical protein PLICRDRAFT_144246 [Plicaturopsis crispa FD-325 SS-3]|nr:hypothetical protein PLICRDRAFT_144246 [Plicaturopsis crispa FD-325 SS-3]
MSNPIREFAYGPTDQEHYAWDAETDQWVVVPLKEAHAPLDQPLSQFSLITWNVDAYSAGGPTRMSAILDYLLALISSRRDDIPVVIFLQEMAPASLRQITTTGWVQKQFYITDIDNTRWMDHVYGTTTLVDRRLHVEKAFRVHYRDKTDFGRDGLFIDINARPPGASAGARLRLCNTHLESLVAEPPLRPGQVAIVSKYLHSPEIYGSVFAGDMNSIEPFDRTLHTAHGFVDAYLALGGSEDSEDSYTWGPQSTRDLRERYGNQRLDKVWYSGGVTAESLERIGQGARVEESKRKKMRSFGALDFVSDHIGLIATLRVSAMRTEG